MKYVLVPLDRITDLIDKEIQLDFLNSAGVDNWEEYESAYEYYSDRHAGIAVEREFTIYEDDISPKTCGGSN